MNATSAVPSGAVKIGTSSPMALLSDSKSSELVKAVAALKLTQSAPPADSSSSKTAAGEDAGEIDSGYASKTSSQGSSPDSSKFVDGSGVVCNAPPWPIISARKKTKLTLFDIAIPKLTQNRFDDLRELHAENLTKLTRGVPRCRGILMSLKVLGESAATAAPWVFIQCDKAIAGKVRRFFKQHSVESDFKPAKPDAYTPRLDIYVHEMPPLALRGDLLSPPDPPLPDSGNNAPYTNNPLDLYYKSNPEIPFETLCGSKITTLNTGQQRCATIGGLISIHEKGGECKTLGITAGHFLGQEQYTQDLEEMETVDDDPEGGHSDDGQDFELDLESSKSNIPTTSAEDDPVEGHFEEELEFDFAPYPSDFADNTSQYEITEDIGVVIGRVFQTSHEGLSGSSNFDWALFTIDDSSLHLPNIVMGSKVTQNSNVYAGAADMDDRLVTLITSLNGQTIAYLTSSWSYLMLAPGSAMVRTYALKLHPDDKGLKAGDSGAWVVDLMTNQILGHLVASDMFGVGYVVPMEDVLQDIKTRLSLEKIDIFVGHDTPIVMPDRSGMIQDFSLSCPSSSRLLSEPEIRYPDSGYSTLNNSPNGSPF
ncbi:hypothetical protein N431DRAFT_478867 [Stipitochalara longipes BDJ]|nr:hypothetical protein N431DRAFT_478867 [Stipitochalara longipes BDJ]